MCESNRRTEVVELREQQGLTFQKIGQIIGHSSSYAAQLYRREKRYQRDLLRKELYRSGNNREINILLTAGELAVLQKIVRLFYDWQKNDNPQSFASLSCVVQNVGPDVVLHLLNRLAAQRDNLAYSLHTDSSVQEQE